MRTFFFSIAITAASILAAGCGDSGTQGAPPKRTVIDDAYLLCKAMDGTGLTTECSVQASDQAVDVTIDTNGSEARKICAGVASQMAQKTANFAGQWKLRIFSPYSGNRPIASCVLQ